MALPLEGGLFLQLTLSLQHLWRIGLDMGVQWWSSAVVYFPRCTASDNETMSRKARLASKAWEAAHLWSAKGDEDSDDDDDDDAGPDLWDRRFDPQYQTFGAGDGACEEATLPDWDVLAVASACDAKKRVIPPLFSAEVAELPRAAGVEWHAHVGFAGAEAKSVSAWKADVSASMGEGGEHRLVDVYHCALGSGNGISFVQTVVAEGLVASGDGRVRALEAGAIDAIARVAVAKLEGGGANAEGGELVVAARYMDAAAMGDGVGIGVEAGLVVPCASLWDARGMALASVTVYQSVFEDVAGL
jgi:diphthine-ammonia ligase